MTHRLSHSGDPRILAALARLAIAAPRRSGAAAGHGGQVTAVFGIPAASTLSAGGFVDPASESARASAMLAETFHQGDMDLVVVLDSPTSAASGAARTLGTTISQQLAASPFVSQVITPWDEGRPAPGTVSADGKSAMIIAAIEGDENTAPRRARTLADELPPARDGVDVHAGGSALVYSEISRQTQNDLIRMEAVAIPLSFLALVWVFGGLVAAALPVAVGGFAVLGSLAVLRAMAFFTDVSIFALNVAVALGFALAVDYTLLIISRFREELGNGHSREQALVRTMTTAGRTVLFSAMTVALALVGMALFPMYFLKSFAYAGVAVVAFAALAAVAIAPAAIILAGERLDALDVRRLLRKLMRRAEKPAPDGHSGWYRMAKLVMRHAIPLGLTLTAVLLLLGAPFLGVKWGYPDDRVLPTSSSVREVNDRVRTDFGLNSATSVKIVLPDTAGLTETDIATYAAELSRVPDVTVVSAPTGTFAGGQRTGPPSAPTGTAANSAFLTVESSAPLYTPASETQLDRLHAIAPPAQAAALFTGTAQTNRDAVAGITSRLPIVLGFIAVVTLVLLFLLTGSVVLPVKAVVLNILSLTAAFGALVWIFQDGHLGAAGTTTTGTLAINIPVLMFCIAFGLSMDYEVFLLSRIREFWLASSRTSADNDESIALGIESTGRVVTAAALLMTISFAALVFAGVSFMRMFAVGLTIAVLADATVVRMLLVPAYMHVLGRMNWWAPAPLARLHQRVFPADEPAGETSGRRSGRPSGIP